MNLHTLCEIPKLLLWVEMDGEFYVSMDTAVWPTTSPNCIEIEVSRTVVPTGK